ncbi:MAG: TauD/TfdA family dioxygenase [Alphaproteobacteria bacterium]|nr:TauD/TfdA family dioxygenase [Alphaproteobacteria bacterium]
MSLAIRSLSPVMAAEVTGVDLRDPALDADTIARLNDAFHENIVLCIRDQAFEPAQFAAAAGVFGSPVRQFNDSLNFPALPEIGVLSSDDRDVHGTGKRVIRGTTWHTDHSFTAHPPKATILYAIAVPEKGGATSFCNMRAAYQALPDDTKARIDGLQAVHAYESSRSPKKMLTLTENEQAEVPDVVHPLVRDHAPTGTKSLYMSTTRLERIVGMDRPKSDALIDALIAHATQPQFLYDHQWRPGDMVIWDNHCSMHHANADYPLEAKRLLHRIILSDDLAA